MGSEAAASLGASKACQVTGAQGLAYAAAWLRLNGRALIRCVVRGI